MSCTVYNLSILRVGKLDSFPPNNQAFFKLGRHTISTENEIKGIKNHNLGNVILIK